MTEEAFEAIKKEIEDKWYEKVPFSKIEIQFHPERNKIAIETTYMMYGKNITEEYEIPAEDVYKHIGTGQITNWMLKDWSNWYFCSRFDPEESEMQFKEIAETIYMIAPFTEIYEINDVIGRAIKMQWYCYGKQYGFQRLIYRTDEDLSFVINDFIKQYNYSLNKAVEDKS